MRIAVLGPQNTGKSTFIKDFLTEFPHYTTPPETYRDLVEEKELEVNQLTSVDSQKAIRDFMFGQLRYNTAYNVIFDRCPVDFIAYAMCALDQDDIDINDSEVSERFPDIKEALNNLDLILFLPITKENSIEYTEENPAYRKLADKYFKKLYRDDICDIFPKYNHPKVIEIYGDRLARIKTIKDYLI